MKKFLLLFNFIVAISMTQAQSVTTNTSVTLDELLESITTNLECTSISNVISPNNALLNGENFSSFGTFAFQNEPNFPFENGIILSTADASELTNIINSGGSQWPGDVDLEDLIQEPGNSNNATVIEFDFVPFRDKLVVDYLLASNEYPTFVCDFADTFAFIVSGPGIPNVNPYDHDANPNTPDVNLDLGGLNIATIPGTNIPVNPTNIHNDDSCGSGSLGEFAISQFFDDILSDNNILEFGGQTIPMTAEVDLMPGQTYHIKLAIADRADTILDSTVFIDADSFEIGTIPEDLPYQPNLPVTLPECWNTSGLLSFDITNTCSESSENYIQMYGGNYAIETASVNADGLTGIDISFDILNGCADVAEAGKNLILEYFDGNDWQDLDEIDPVDIPVANSGNSNNWMTINYTITSGLSHNFMLRFKRDNGNNLQDDLNIANLKFSESTLSNQEFGTKNFRIYPNPAQDFIKIESPDVNLIKNVEIFDMNGRLINFINKNSSQNLQIDVKYFDAGIYFIKLNLGNQSVVKRFIKS